LVRVTRRVEQLVSFAYEHESASTTKQ